MHYLHIGDQGRASTFDNVLSEYRRFGLRSAAAARSVIDRVREVASQRQRYYEQAGLNPTEIARIEAALSAWRQ